MTLEEIRRLLEQYRQRLNDLTDELRNLPAGEEATDESRQRAEQIETVLRTEHEGGAERGLLDEIERLEEKEQLAERAFEVANRGGRYTAPGDDRGPQHVSRDDPFDLDSLRVSALADPQDVAEQIRGRARTAIEHMPDVADEGRERMTRLIERNDPQGNLARRVVQCGSPAYERAFASYLAGKPLDNDESRALSVGTDSEGGFAVPVFLDPTLILTSDGSVNPIRQIARVETITTKEWQGVTTGAISASYASEAAESSDDAPTLSRGGPITPQRAHVFIPFSYEAEQDWNAMRAEMAMLIQESKDDLEATQFVTGDGTAPNPQGVVTGLSATETVSTATAGTFAAEDVYAVDNNLPSRFRARARWIFSKEVGNDVRQFASSDGHDLWERIGNGMPPQVLGYPRHEASAMSSDSTTTGNNIMLLGDFRHYIVVDRVGMSVELVPHVFGTNQRPTGQRGIYAFWRNSADVVAQNAFRRLQVS